MDLNVPNFDRTAMGIVNVAVRVLALMKYSEQFFVQGEHP